MGWHSSGTRKNGSCRTVVGAIDDRIDYWEYGGDLLLVVHMINDASHSKKEGEAYIKPSSRWYSNIEVIISRDLEEGDELIIMYQVEVITKREKKREKEKERERIKKGKNEREKKRGRVEN